MIADCMASLFVGKVEDVQGWVKAKVARSQKFFWLHPGRRVWSKMAGVFVEPKLNDGQAHLREALHYARRYGGAARLTLVLYDDE